VSLRAYLALVWDSTTIIRTLRRVYGNKSARPAAPYAEGHARGICDAIHPARVPVRISDIRWETPSTRTLIVVSTGDPMPPATPGQYVNVFTEIEGVRTSRPMSISLVSEDALELTIKRKPDGFVSGHLLDQLEVGDELLISGPEGDFHHMPVRDGHDLVFIAAGSGITPFMGMIEQILQRSPEARVRLLYGNRSADEIIFHQRLVDLAAQHPALRLHLTLSEPEGDWTGERGRIDSETIEQVMTGERLDDKTFFVCGPKPMEQATIRGLRQLGVRRGRIRAEPSGPEGDPTELAAWPAEVQRSQTFEVRLAGRDQPVTARASEPLVNSLERAGITLPVLCRSGNCGSCRTRVNGGELLRAAGPAERDSDRVGSFIHACVCYPLSDLTLTVSPDSSLGEPCVPAQAPAARPTIERREGVVSTKREASGSRAV